MYQDMTRHQTSSATTTAEMADRSPRLVMFWQIGEFEYPASSSLIAGSDGDDTLRDGFQRVGEFEFEVFAGSVPGLETAPG